VNAVPTISTPIRRRSRRRAIVLLAIGMLLAGGWMAIRRMVSPEVIRATAENLIQDQINGHATIGSVELSWFGGIRLRNVAIWGHRQVANSPQSIQSAANANASALLRPGAQSDQQPDIEIPEIRVDQGLWSLMFHHLDVHSVTGMQPTIRLDFDSPDGRPNLAALFRKRTDTVSSLQWPSIELRDARLILSRRGLRGTEIGDERLQLTVRGRPSGSDSGLYDIVWQDTRDESGYVQIDVRTGLPRNVRGGLPSISTESLLEFASAMVPGAADWLHDFQLSGRVVITDFDFLHGASDDRSLVEFSLEKSTVEIPIAEWKDLPNEADRVLRLSDVSGHARLTPAGGTAEFISQFRGADCRITATATSTAGSPSPTSQEKRPDFTSSERLSQLGILVTADISGFRLPRDDANAPESEKRFVRLRHEFAEFYQHYNPRGIVDAHVEMERPPGSDHLPAIKVVRVTARNGEASYFLHPYHCTNLTGAVEYRDGGISIQDICGTHGESKVCLNGSLDRPSACAPAKIEVTVTNLAIDDDLYTALGPRYLTIKDQFAPQGRLDAKIHLQRDECTEYESRAPFHSRVEIGLKNLQARYDHFPVPVDGIQGEVEVEGDRFAISRIRGRAAGGTISVKGNGRIRDKGASELAIEITGHDVTANETLIASLPQSCADEVARLHPEGRFDFHTTSAIDPGTKSLTHHTIIELDNMQLKDEQYPLPLESVRGEIDVKADELVVRGVTARHGDSNLSIGGTVGLGDNRRVNLAMEARDLRIDESVRSALPLKTQDILKEWRVESPIDANLYIRAENGDRDGMTVHGDVELNGDTVWHSGFPEPFRDVRGVIQFENATTQAESIEANFLGVPLAASFQTEFSDDTEHGTIRLVARGLPFDSRTRGLMPARLQTTWDAIRPSGTVDLVLDSLQYSRPRSHELSSVDSHSQSGSETWEVAGHLELSNASFPGLGRMSKVDGVFDLKGFLKDRTGGTSIDGAIRLNRAELYDRLVEDVAGNWAFVWSSDGKGRATIDRFSGTMYGGELAGKADLQFDNVRASYDLAATLNKVSAGPLINAGRVAHPVADDSPVDVRGQASANVYLSGITGSTDSRRGGGRVEIQDGYICKLPLLLAIFNVLNMTIPSNDTIDQAVSDFFIMGNTLSIRSLVLQGGGATFEGSGTVSIPDQAVDLSLVNAGSQSGFRVPLLSNLVEGATRQLMEIEVTGPISHPVARARPLPNLTDEMHRIFRMRRAKPIAPSPN